MSNREIGNCNCNIAIIIVIVIALIVLRGTKWSVPRVVQRNSRTADHVFSSKWVCKFDQLKEREIRRGGPRSNVLVWVYGC